MNVQLAKMSRGMQHGAAQLIRFGVQQALACLFSAVIFASLAVTKIVDVPWLRRYDWLLLICLGMQWWMVRSGLETRDELKVITVFHVIGLALEIFKVNMGSWSYPDAGLFKVFGVPLFSGFMYASIIIGSTFVGGCRRLSF